MRNNPARGAPPPTRLEAHRRTPETCRATSVNTWCHGSEDALRCPPTSHTSHVTHAATGPTDRPQATHAGRRLKLRRGFAAPRRIGWVRFVGRHGVRWSREAPRLQPALRCPAPRPDRERLLRPGRRPGHGASPPHRPPHRATLTRRCSFPFPSFADPIVPPPPPPRTRSAPRRRRS